MDKQKDIAFFENKLLDFMTSSDPILEMMQWVLDKFREIAISRNVGLTAYRHERLRT